MKSRFFILALLLVGIFALSQVFKKEPSSPAPTPSEIQIDADLLTPEEDPLTESETSPSPDIEAPQPGQTPTPDASPSPQEDATEETSPPQEIDPPKETPSSPEILPLSPEQDPKLPLTLPENPPEKSSVPSVKIFKKNIVSVLEETGDYDLFLEMLKEFELLYLLQENPQMTLFAPPDEFLEKAQKDPSLRDVFVTQRSDLLPIALLSHITAGALSMDDLIALNAVETLTGIPILLQTSQAQILLNQKIQILDGAIKTSNGFVYPIDGFINPF